MVKLQVPEHILSIKPYQPGKPLEELEREYGIADSVKLASNENPLGPSPFALKAIQKNFGKLHRYPDSGGHDLTKKIAGALGVDKSCVVLGAGSDDIIGMLAQAFLGPGTEAIIPKPSFLMYEICAVSSGAVPVIVPLNQLTIDLDAMRDAVTSRTRMVFICNPNNPTGTVVCRKDFESFLEALPEDVVVVLDEAYIEFVRSRERFSGIEFLHMNRPVVVLRTFSKAYGLAGLRIGYGVMPAVIADVLHRIRLPFSAGSLAQAGAEAAMDDESFLKKSVALVHEGLDFLYDGLDRLGVRFFPTQSNFFLIDIERDAKGVFEAMLRQGIIIRSMASYEYPNYIRVNVGLPEENSRFLYALKRVLND